MKIPLIGRLEKRLPNKVTQSVHRKGLVLKKNAPHIAFGVGVVGAVGATVLACRATLKLHETMDEIENDLSNVKELRKGVEKNYPVDQLGRDTAYVYVKSGAKLVKLYGPALTVGTLSIGLLTSSHVAMARRNTALVAAYTALQSAYDNYRERVIGELGAEKELDIYHAVTATETVDGEVRKFSDPNKFSPYARFFDEISPHFEKNAEYNRIYIQARQNYLNDLLQARGHVFLNEAYDALGLEHTRAGAVVGWIIGGDGDNYIDFGLFQASNAQFINGTEPRILLDFNVDGVIYDKI